MINCMIAGVGGQGTVLASKLIAAAAMNKGLNVRTTETIGMAQRGGCVVSHIRIGRSIYSPLIPLKGVHAAIAFEPAEAVRILPYLADDGVLIVCDTAVKPVTSSLIGDTYQASVMLDYLKTYAARLVPVSGEKLLAQCGNAKALNVALLGTAVQSGILPFGAEELKRAIKEMLPQHFWEMNIASFEIGRRMYNEV
ncbi:indolepyruvate ferredoxin oxidoreductase beta subunit [Anaerobacterium chartisolvens]|uniref:Indolepyruvate ferredoxin oxidoreductase beta subunit n=1 Tax=Anaerobacterium chartisolvens TaxID=1297424 RepID=A0A369AVS9_9FIRM|nr:indolepyruvate oxidoreductase subunit beta [Anaerobacterium chartisolvens]RCX12317.1 indolepyruvate ferredoxin oxidoreductase beta subunit [Anaerobacterium chartisolvens]